MAIKLRLERSVYKIELLYFSVQVFRCVIHFVKNKFLANHSYVLINIARNILES